MENFKLYFKRIISGLDSPKTSCSIQHPRKKRRKGKRGNVTGNDASIDGYCPCTTPRRFSSPRVLHANNDARRGCTLGKDHNTAFPAGIPVRKCIRSRIPCSISHERALFSFSFQRPRQRNSILGELASV